MGMTIRTNILSNNSLMHLNKNNKKSALSLEKLSSGFKINRAGDDASGLAISEQMKAQITALGTASNNCDDGISLIQTAEGYMEEIHNMLNRMVELAEKSANGILENSGNTGYWAYGETGSVQNAGIDRAALQMEMDQLCAEIDRVAMTANFNGNRLFYPNNDETVKDFEKNYGWVDEWESTIESNKFIDPHNKYALQVGETSNKADKIVLNLRFMTTDALFTRAPHASYMELKETASDGSTKIWCSMIPNHQDKFYDGDNNIWLPYHGDASMYEWGMTMNISDQNYASFNAEIARKVINDISMQRAQLGALQNRLDYTINNLDTAKENVQFANSRIRDTDMAKEMMSYTQNNILTQAAQAMLAQANAQPQNVLQLLQ